MNRISVNFEVVEYEVWLMLPRDPIESLDDYLGSVVVGHYTLTCT